MGGVFYSVRRGFISQKEGVSLPEPAASFPAVRGVPSHNYSLCDARVVRSNHPTSAPRFRANTLGLLALPHLADSHPEASPPSTQGHTYPRLV